jgi:hypothetical protein
MTDKTKRNKAAHRGTLGGADREDALISERWAEHRRKAVHETLLEMLLERVESVIVEIRKLDNMAKSNVPSDLMIALDLLAAAKARL